MLPTLTRKIKLIHAIIGSSEKNEGNLELALKLVRCKMKAMKVEAMTAR